MQPLIQIITFLSCTIMGGSVDFVTRDIPLPLNATGFLGVPLHGRQDACPARIPGRRSFGVQMGILFCSVQSSRSTTRGSPASARSMVGELGSYMKQESELCVSELYSLFVFFSSHNFTVGLTVSYRDRLKGGP